MRVVAVYKQATDETRTVEEFLHDFTTQTGHTLETLDPESTEGTTFCEAYDITSYPTLIALSSDGQMQNMWVGTPLPTISEVSYYV